MPWNFGTPEVWDAPPFFRKQQARSSEEFIDIPPAVFLVIASAMRFSMDHLDPFSATVIYITESPVDHH